jgi:hypothetical protein
MRLRCARELLASPLFLCMFASVSFAGTVTGTVRNGTSGRPAVDVEVILIKLQGAMQPVANTKTDSAGHYKFDYPDIGTGPMLLRAVYRGVFYHEPLTPDKNTVDLEVFEPTDKPSAVSVKTHIIALQPSDAGLNVDEDYEVENKTQPPHAYYRPDGSFLISIPDGAQLGDVSAGATASLPVIQNPIRKSANESAIAYAFRPGSSSVRFTYKLPYANDAANLRFVSPYAADRVAILAPPPVQVNGAGLSPAGQQQGFNIYLRDSVAANTPVEVAISGTAPLSQSNGGSPGGDASADNSQNPSVNSRANSGAEMPTASVTTLPARLDSLKWVIVAGFAAVFSLGLFYVWRQTPRVAAEGPAVSSKAVSPTATSAVQSPVAAATAPNPVAADAPRPAPSSAPGDFAEVDRAVRASLDDLKDSLFRLELRRQAGTISEEEYARQHAVVQTVLRDLVKG